VPRLRTPSGEATEGPPEREALLAAVTRARAEDRLEDAMEGCRRLLELDKDDEAARRAMSEIESVLVDREVDVLVGMALTYAADGEFTLATGIAEKVERLAPWSPRYLQLQVYLDEEGARRKADSLVATAREHLAAGRDREARAAAHDALAAMPGHNVAHKLLEELPEAAPGRAAKPGPTPGPAPVSAPAPAPVPAATPAATPAPAPPLDPRIAEAVALSAAALQHFLKDDHDRARKTVERALTLDPTNRRALELQKILRVLG
jgi:tetratricopeptide (TPR) repeat protein